MPIELIALPPVAFSLWLLAGASGVLARWPLKERVGMVLAAAVVTGPLALAALGLFGWLVMLALATVGLTAFAVTRRGGRGRPWALPRP